MEKAELFAVAIVALAIGLALISFLPFTIAWIASIALVALACVATVLGINVTKAMKSRCGQPLTPSGETSEADLHEEVHGTGADFIRA